MLMAGPLSVTLKDSDVVVLEGVKEQMRVLLSQQEAGPGDYALNEKRQGSATHRRHTWCAEETRCSLAPLVRGA
jgi:hypothetical protein